jgi:hypothetical protein
MIEGQTQHDFRGKFSRPIWKHLKELQALWGYRYPIQVLEHLIVEAHQRFLSPSHWDGDIHRAVAVLHRLRPNLLLTPADILEVRLSATTAKIQVKLEADLFVVSRKEWDA